MVTRREAMTSGALGALASAGAEASGGTTQSNEQIAAESLKSIAEDVERIRLLMREAFIGPSVAAGAVADVRKQFTIFLRSNQKFPDFCEIGTGIFLELYDWHVRYQQAIEMSRVDNRVAIRFMFTWMVLRPEQGDQYVGIPFDRG